MYVQVLAWCSLQALESYVQQNYPHKFCSSSVVPIKICGDELVLSWPKDNGWEVVPDDEPCKVHV